MKLVQFALIIFIQVAWSVNPVHAATFHLPDNSSQSFRDEASKVIRFFDELIQWPDLLQKRPILVEFAEVGVRCAEALFRGNQPVVRIDNKFLGTWQAPLYLVHETVHLIRHSYSPNEELWSDEGLAKLAETLYSGIYAENYERALNQLTSYSLTNSSDKYTSGEGYVTSYFLMKYLYNHFGKNYFFKKVLQSSLKGWAALEKSIQDLNSTDVDGTRIINYPSQRLNAVSFWRHFAFALLLNTTTTASNGFFFLDSNYSSILVHRETTTLINETLIPPSAGSSWTIRFAKTITLENLIPKSGELSVFSMDMSKSPFQIQEVSSIQVSPNPSIYIFISSPK